METLLTRWLEDTEATFILDEASVSQVREQVRQVGRAQGLPDTEVERLALVVSELAHNQLTHARGGSVAVRPVWREGVPGVEVIAADRGTGIPNPTEALHGRPKPTGSLGAGLPSVQRQADEVDVDVRWQEGTCVRARKFATPPARRCEVAVLGRPHPEETRCGDQALWLWRDELLLVGVADGLGHGQHARTAADRAMEVLRQHPQLPPDQLLLRCDASLQGTRGAAVSVVRVERPGGKVEHACLGNVSTLLCQPNHVEALPCTPGVIGMPQRAPRFRALQSRLLPGNLLVLYTDGLATRTTVDDPLLLRRHPLEVAHTLMRRFGKDHDDALVLVARVG